MARPSDKERKEREARRVANAKARADAAALEARRAKQVDDIINAALNRQKSGDSLYRSWTS